MTSQQLIEARAALWHHNAEPILTLDDAASWVAATGFLLFLPRHQQLRAPSPTFVEACIGKLEHTPARPEIETALSLAHRLFDSGDVLPLNLLGTLSEEPDFLIARDRLPWLLSLRGDRSWKTAPGGRTSPLNVSVWKLLDEQGELSADEIRSGIGREVTDASIRRALVDLWGTLRVFPRYSGSKTMWVLTKTLCPKECTKGVTTAQGAALSLFLADYLRSVIAATEDEIAAFLSPLASRSKLREVLHALVATRQLSTITLGPNTLYYVVGELPEFPEIAAPEVSAESVDSSVEQSGDVTEYATPSERQPHERIQKYAPRAESREPYQRRESYQRDSRPPRDFRRTESGRPASRSGFQSRSGEDRGSRPRRDDREGRENRPPRRDGGFKPREGGFRPRGEGEFRPRDKREFKPRGESGFRPPFRKPRPKSESGDSGFERTERPERAPRSTGEERPAFRKSGFGDRERKPFARKFEGSGDRKPYGERKSYGERKPYGERKSFGENKPYGERKRPDSGDRKPYARKFEGGGERKSYGDRKPYGERKSFGENKPYGERKRPDSGERKPYARKFEGGGERKSYGDRKPFGERKSYGERKSFGENKPYGDRKRSDFKSRDERSGSRPDFRKSREGDERPRRDSESSGRSPRKSFGTPGGFSKPGGKSFGNGPSKTFGKPPAKGGKKPFGKGPGKPAGKSGVGKGPGKSFGGKFSKGPGRGPVKGSFRGAGRPRRRPE